jgi:predicted GNAT superfamily acetyltransferase
MTIRVEELTSHEAFAACRAVQHAVGTASGELLSAPILVGIQRSGGLVLGAWDDTDPTPSFLGCLVDLVATGRRAARLTLFRGVLPERRGRGIGYRLRCVERERLRGETVAVVRWAIDPLRSVDAHVAMNKLGAVAVGYERDLYGPSEADRDRGLATDRLVVEWRLDSPRVCAIIDQGRLPPHFDLGLDRMGVVTRTTATESGGRRLLGTRQTLSGEVLLAEIPADLDRIRDEEDVRRAWRLGTRELFEEMLAEKYLITGFVHQGGRSFHLFERTGRDEAFERIGATRSAKDGGK